MNKMKKIREKKKITVIELAGLVGVTPRYLWFIEAGEKNPSLKVAKKIADALETNILAIFYDCT